MYNRFNLLERVYHFWLRKEGAPKLVNYSVLGSNQLGRSIGHPLRVTFVY